jgi:branched-chain amino acid transport system substrate-binding protein
MTITRKEISAAFVMIACLRSASASPVAAAEPYKVNVSLGLTGQGALLGSQIRASLKLIEARTNKSGGIKGRPLRFVISDDQTNPQIAVQLFNGYIASKAPIVLGPALTAPCLAIAPLVSSNGPLTWCQTPSVEPARGSYVFTVSASLSDDINVIIRYFRLKGFNRIGIITGNDATGQNVERFVALALTRPENKNLHVVASERFGLTDINVAAQMSRLKAAAPEAIIAWSTGSPWGTLLHGINDSGIDMPIAASPGNMLYTQMAQFADLLPSKLVFPGPSALKRGGARPGPVRDAQDAFYKAFDSIGARPDFGNLICWDAVNIAVNALKTLGPGATANQLRDYIETLHGWAGTQGVYDFADGRQRGVGENAVSIMGWDKAKKDWTLESRPNGYLK